MKNSISKELVVAELAALKSEAEVLINQLAVINSLNTFISLGELLGFNLIDVYAPDGNHKMPRAITFSSDEEYIKRLQEI